MSCGFAAICSDPDVRDAAYRGSRTWKFGEAVALPEPFDREIPTIKWKTWADDLFQPARRPSCAAFE